jgi:hypothetical protein
MQRTTFTFACLVIAASASLKSSIIESADQGMMTEELTRHLAEFTQEAETNSSSPIRVSKAEFRNDFFFNYPDIFTLTYGSKSNVSIVYNTFYSEPGPSVSQITLHPKI